MALGRQLSPTQTLVTFCYWAKRKGYHVGEMHGFSRVHNVHTRGSWHYDKQGKWGKAADINWRGSGEPARLRTAVAKAEELGLGVIYALYGTNGPAANHRTHLHVDVGPYSNLGRGAYTPKGGGDWMTSRLQRAVRTTADEIWGKDTERRLQAVRMASNFKGNKFPHGKRLAQRAVGTEVDNIWGNASRRAHDRTVVAIQQVLSQGGYYHGKIDGIWGSMTDKAFMAARDLRRRV